VKLGSLTLTARISRSFQTPPGISRSLYCWQGPMIRRDSIFNEDEDTGTGFADRLTGSVPTIELCGHCLAKRGTLRCVPAWIREPVPNCSDLRT
jgi:hypothetical protein